MRTLNRVLEQKILAADGSYLDAQGLQPLEQYFQSYTTRLDTYQYLRDHSQKLVLQALRKLAQVYPELIHKHGQRCQYDMTEVLRYIITPVFERQLKSEL